MGALAHTVDLPARVKDPARVKNKVLDTKDTVQAKVEAVGQGLHRGLQMGTETLQDKAEEATSEAKNLTNRALARLAPPAGGRVKQLAETVRQRPVLAVAAVVPVAAVVSVFMVLRRLLRSNH